jgi:hypothetical protein
MRLPSKFIPQADLLEDVVRVAQAVKLGATSFQAIASYIGKVDRQGRYYRLAAEIIGLISNRHNHSELTPLGKDFLEASSDQQARMLREAVLNSKLFKRLVPFLELYPKGVTKQSLENFMAEVTEQVGETMMDRRVSTVVSWLSSLGMLREEGTRYVLTEALPNDVGPIEYDEIGEPLFPKTASLREYREVAERAKKAHKSVSIMRNDAAVERASNEHRRLVNLVASRVRSAGVLPRCNQLIDLAARVHNTAYLFEMKSTTPKNMRSQIRVGISQLFEYRYLQDTPKAALVLVVESPLPEDLNWMQHFLEKDRQIRLIWDGHDQLFASSETKKELPFLWAT